MKIRTLRCASIVSLLCVCLCGCDTNSEYIKAKESWASIVLDHNDPSTWIDENKAILPTESDAKEIVIGSTIDDVVHLIGKPQREVGYGRIIFEFDLSNSNILRAYFVSDIQQELDSVPEDDSGLIGASFVYLTDFEVVIR